MPSPSSKWSTSGPIPECRGGVTAGRLCCCSRRHLRVKAPSPREAAVMVKPSQALVGIAVVAAGILVGAETGARAVPNQSDPTSPSSARSMATPRTPPSTWSAVVHCAAANDAVPRSVSLSSPCATCRFAHWSKASPAEVFPGAHGSSSWAHQGDRGHRLCACPPARE